MASKRYQIKTACPQCGCAEVTVLSAEEMQEKYGDEPHITQDCSECGTLRGANGSRLP